MPLNIITLDTQSSAAAIRPLRPIIYKLQIVNLRDLNFHSHRKILICVQVNEIILYRTQQKTYLAHLPSNFHL